jgi:hypothetical protein
VEKSRSIQIRIYGESAECLQKAGDGKAALSCLKQVKKDFGSDTDEELAILQAERKLSTLRNEDHLVVAALERCLAIDPANGDLRFVNFSSPRP